MALVACPECQKEVSSRALACPQCAFPFPGQASVEDQSGTNLFACPDCGSQISRQAQTCFHCGGTLVGKNGSVTVQGDAAVETWLCPHCGTTYTRKLRQEQEVVSPHQSVLTSSEVNSVERSLNPESGQTMVHESQALLNQRSLLWQDSSLPTNMVQNVVSPRYPRSRKKSLVAELIMFVLVAASIVLGALWPLQGINPLEALVDWRL